MHVHPYRHFHVHHLATFALSALLVISVCSWPASFLITNATVHAPLLVRLARNCALVQTVLLPVPLILMVLIVGFMNKHRCQCTAGMPWTLPARIGEAPGDRLSELSQPLSHDSEAEPYESASVERER